MKDPSKFTKVSIVSFSLVTTLYISLGFMGAKLFGPQIFWGEISRMSLILNVVLIVVGGLLGVVGTISSSKLLAKSLKRAHDLT
ncbi:hypothetical protein KY289_037546 [Solanum tuberosum]|nr:hypothetical protein KY289_037546 [Solanum tuberosum]